MKFLILSALVVCASALPLDDTIEVQEAKAAFQKAFDAAKVGDHADLAPQMIENSYLEDEAEVKAAKVAFLKAFEQAELGQHAELAPKPVEALPVEPLKAPVLYSYPSATYYNQPYHYAVNSLYNVAPYWNNYYSAAPYWNTWASPYYNYHQYYPFIAPVKAEEVKVEEE